MEKIIINKENLKKSDIDLILDYYDCDEDQRNKFKECLSVTSYLILTKSYFLQVPYFSDYQKDCIVVKTLFDDLNNLFESIKMGLL